MRPHSLSRWLVAVAFLAVVLAFLFSSVAFVQVTGSIERDARQIAENSSPSIEHLAAARVSLVRLHDLLSDEVDKCVRHRPVDLTGADEAEEDLKQQEATYERIPSYADEARLAEGIAGYLSQLYGSVRQARFALQSGDCEQARKLVEGPVAASMAQASLGFMRDIQLNARHTARAAQAIGETREKAERLAMLLNVAAVVVAMGAAASVVFGLRRSDRVQAEYLRLQEERSNELEQFAARVAHDIRSPMAAVVLALDLAQRTNDPTRWIVKSRNSLRRMEQIVDALYQFALSGGAARPGVTPNAAEVVEDVLEALQTPATEAGIELRAESVLTDTVGCPPGVLATLLTNLVQNAIKYAGREGGRVVISTTKTQPKLRFSVADNGPGLPPGIAEKVFKPYVRVDPASGSGLGLGLATVQRLTQAYGGTCGVDSVEGSGATFWFELPMLAGPPSTPLREKRTAAVEHAT